MGESRVENLKRINKCLYLFKFSMNYLNLYATIIDRAKIRQLSPDEYSEKHHILPRSLGGSDLSENIVRLTAKEHFICHRLLVKLYIDNKQNYMKMLKAFLMMLSCHSTTQNRYVTSREYSKLKTDFSILQSELMSGDGNPRFGSFWVSNPYTGESKVIKGDIPDGWIKGRNKKYEYCPICAQSYFGVNKTCGNRECLDFYMGIDRDKVNKRKGVVRTFKYSSIVCSICTNIFRSKLVSNTCPSCTVKPIYFGKAVIDDKGVIFNSLTAAANYYAVTVEAIRYRIKNCGYQYFKNTENYLARC